MGHYRLNPQAKISLQIARPVPGQGMQRVGLGQRQPLNVQDMLNYLFSSGILQTLAQITHSQQISAEELNPSHLQTLVQMGLILPVEEVQPERVYICSVPAFPETPMGNGFLQTDQALPLALSGQFEWPSVFSQARPVLWIDDPRTHLLWPYWLSPSSTENSQLKTAKQSSGSFQSFCSADLTFSLSNLKTQLRSQGYVVLSQIVPVLQKQALCQYLQVLRAGGYFDQGSVQVPLRNVIHNEPVMYFLLGQFAQLLNAILPTPVKPSYTYLAEYQEGAVLDKHVDREQCLWNISLALDASPDLSVAEKWPILLDLGGAPKPIHLRVGDAVLYPGAHIPHWREALPAGQRVCMGLFHFVSPDFQGVLL